MNYNRNEKALIFLSQFDFMTSSKFEKILEVFSCPKDIFDFTKNNVNCLKHILKDNYNILINVLSQYNEKEFFGILEKRNIKCLTILSENYPKKLLNLKNPPYVLFYVGNIHLINTKAIAMVGTRTPSSNGKQITGKYIVRKGTKFR